MSVNKKNKKVRLGKKVKYSKLFTFIVILIFAFVAGAYILSTRAQVNSSYLVTTHNCSVISGYAIFSYYNSITIINQNNSKIYAVILVPMTGQWSYSIPANLAEEMRTLKISFQRKLIIGSDLVISSNPQSCSGPVNSPKPSPISPVPVVSPRPVTTTPIPTTKNPVSAELPKSTPLPAKSESLQPSGQSANSGNLSITYTQNSTRVSAIPQQNNGIKLSWNATEGATHYALERSTDQINWVTIKNDIVGTEFIDTSTDFATKYYYRILAYKSGSLTSGSVATEAISNAFNANVGIGSEVAISSDDNIVRLIIPSNAVGKPTNCSIISPGELLKPKYEKYDVAHGPYQVVCKQADGSDVNYFNADISATLNLLNFSKKYQNVVVFESSNSDGNWAINQTKPVNNTFTLGLKRDTKGIVVMGLKKPPKTRLYVVLGVGVVIIMSLIIIFLMRWYLNNFKKDDLYDITPE